jgi:hypothetical protein
VRAIVDSFFLVVPLCGAIPCLRCILLTYGDVARVSNARKQPFTYMHACRHLCTAAPLPTALPKGLLGSPSARTLAVTACIVGGMHV